MGLKCTQLKLKLVLGSTSRKSRYCAIAIGNFFSLDLPHDRVAPDFRTSALLEALEPLASILRSPDRSILFQSLDGEARRFQQLSGSLIRVERFVAIDVSPQRFRSGLQQHAMR